MLFAGTPGLLLCFFSLKNETGNALWKCMCPFQHSTTWASVVAGGLGDYGSDESGNEDEDERSLRGSESSDTDEEELHHRIREKQDAFRRKEREMLLQQEKQAQEALLARGREALFVRM